MHIYQKGEKKVAPLFCRSISQTVFARLVYSENQQCDQQISYCSKKRGVVDTIHPPEDKNYADHPVNYKALLPSGIAPDMPLITRALSSYPAIDWYNYDSALFCFCLLQLFDPSLQLLLFLFLCLISPLRLLLSFSLLTPRHVSQMVTICFDCDTNNILFPRSNIKFVHY